MLQLLNKFNTKSFKISKQKSSMIEVLREFTLESTLESGFIAKDVFQFKHYYIVNTKEQRQANKKTLLYT